MIESVLISLALTIAIELIFALCLKKRGKDLLLVVIVNAITNPIVVFTSNMLALCSSISRFLYVIPLEAGAVAVEWLIYRGYAQNIKRPLLFSLAANAISYSLGLLISTLF